MISKLLGFKFASRPAHTFIYVTQARTFRLDTDRKGRITGDLEVLEYVCDSANGLPGAMEALIEQSEERLGRKIWLFYSRLNSHLLSLPSVQLAGVGLTIQKTRAVSYFRVGLLKRAVPTGLLVALDRLLQPTGALCQLSPSVFVRCQGGDKAAPAAGAFFRCTVCGSTTDGTSALTTGGSTMLVEEGDILSCTDCDARFAIRDGIYDFEAPLEGGAR